MVRHFPSWKNKKTEKNKLNDAYLTSYANKKINEKKFMSYIQGHIEKRMANCLSWLAVWSNKSEIRARANRKNSSRNSPRDFVEMFTAFLTLLKVY